MDRIVNNAYRIELKGPSRRPKMPDDQMWESCRADAPQAAELFANGQADLPGESGEKDQDA